MTFITLIIRPQTQTDVYNMYNLLAVPLLLLVTVLCLAVQHCSCQTPTPVHFDCPKLPPLPTAKTVYELTPQDIRVVRLTAGKRSVSTMYLVRHLKYHHVHIDV